MRLYHRTLAQNDAQVGGTKNIEQACGAEVGHLETLRHAGRVGHGLGRRLDHGLGRHLGLRFALRHHGVEFHSRFSSRPIGGRLR